MGWDGLRSAVDLSVDGALAREGFGGKDLVVEIRVGSAIGKAILLPSVEVVCESDRAGAALALAD